MLELERLPVKVRRFLRDNAPRYEIVGEGAKAAIQLTAYVYETLDGSVQEEPDRKRAGTFAQVPALPNWLAWVLTRIFGSREIRTKHTRIVHRRVCPHMPIDEDGERTDHLVWLTEASPEPW